MSTKTITKTKMGTKTITVLVLSGFQVTTRYLRAPLFRPVFVQSGRLWHLPFLPPPHMPCPTSAIGLGTGEGREKGLLTAPRPSLLPLCMALLPSWFQIGPSVVSVESRGSLLENTAPGRLRRDAPAIFDGMRAPDPEGALLTAALFGSDLCEAYASLAVTLEIGEVCATLAGDEGGRM